MPEWFEGLEAADLAHATERGWNQPLSPEIASKMLQAHRNAQSLIGSDPAAVIKLPKDANDPSYAGIYDRVVGLGLPKSPDEYKFDGVVFKDGTTFAGADADFVRSMAAENKLTGAQARGVAARLAEHFDMLIAETATESAAAAAAAKQANDTALRTAWAADYDNRAAGAANMLDALKAIGVPVSFDGLDAQAHVAAMTGLFNASEQLRESPMLRGGDGGRNVNTTMTPEQAQARFDELKMNPEWFKKVWEQPGSAEHMEFQNLQAAMVGVTPEEAARFRAGGRITR